MLSSDNFSLLQASIVSIAEPSLPLLISSPQRLTAWWCRFMCILFSVDFYFYFLQEVPVVAALAGRLVVCVMWWHCQL